MLERKKLLVVAVLISFLGIIFLYAYALSIHPKRLPIGEIGSDDVGSSVQTKGLIKQYQAHSYGGLTLLLIDYNDYATIKLFLSREAYDGLDFKQRIVPGAEVEVSGEVQEFGGDLEIFISSPLAIKILKDAKENELSIETLAKNPVPFQGIYLKTYGMIYGLSVIIDEKRINVSDGSHSLWAFAEKEVSVGGPVDVYGRLLYNEIRERWEIKIAETYDNITTSPSLTPPGYAEKTLEDILSQPETSEGQLIAIKNVSATKGELIGTSFSLSDMGEMEMYSINCLIFGWNWDSDKKGVLSGSSVSFYGRFDYYEPKAQWQITSENFTIEI